MKDVVIAILALGVLLAWPLWKICRKAGFPTWLAVILAFAAYHRGSWWIWLAVVLILAAGTLVVVCRDSAFDTGGK